MCELGLTYFHIIVLAIKITTETAERIGTRGKVFTSEEAEEEEG